MALISLVQTVSAENASSASARTVTLPGNVTAGNFIAIGVTSFNSGITVTVTDSLGNTYTQAGSYAVNSSNRASLWYAYNVTGGACTITVTPSAAAFLTLCAAEFSGVKSSADPIDGTSNNNATGTTATAGSVTVSQAQTLVLAQLTLAASSRLSDPQNVAIACHRLNSGNEPGALLMALVDAAIDPTSILTASTAYAIAAAAFKPAAVSGGSTAYVIGG